MRVIQILPNISYGDAVSNDCIAIHSILRELKIDSEIYALNIGKGIKHIRHISKLPSLGQTDAIIYHYSIGSDLTDIFINQSCIKILRYHSITPPHFFLGYNWQIFDMAEKGYSDLYRLKPYVHYIMADSEFNKNELLGFGYTCEIEILPVIIHFDEYDTQPSDSVLMKYSNDKVNILFVGRVVPNKKIEDLITSFMYYNKGFNSDSRLIIAGSTPSPVYLKRLNDYIESLNTQDVIFTGHIKFNEILALYRSADIYLCLSEHEGFCVPLLEAAYFDVPIIAYNSTAIPETLSGGGVLINKKDYKLIASLINRIIKNKAFAGDITSKQKEMLKCYDFSLLSKKLEAYFIKINSFSLRKEN